MTWVDYPLNGLAPGYYPVETTSPGVNNRPRPQNNRYAVNKKESQTSAGRITELKEVAYVDIVSSAAGKMTIGKDVVRYVNAVEDVYVAGRRR